MTKHRIIFKYLIIIITTTTTIVMPTTYLAIADWAMNTGLDSVVNGLGPVENGLLSEVIPGNISLDSMPGLTDVNASNNPCSAPSSPVGHNSSPHPSSRKAYPSLSPNLSPTKTLPHQAASQNGLASQEQGEDEDNNHVMSVARNGYATV